MEQFNVIVPIPANPIRLKKPTVVVLFKTKANQFRLLLPSVPTLGEEPVVERRATAALGEITWVPSPLRGGGAFHVMSMALAQLGAGVYNPLPEGLNVPRGVFPSSPENPAPCGECTLTIVLEGEVQL